MTESAIVAGAFIDPAVARDRRRRNAILMGRILVAGSLILIWELVAPHIDHLVFSSPGEIIAKCW
jgi:ABC-type nitrate/sulfonate/bicarbonate transport system permease component